MCLLISKQNLWTAVRKQLSFPHSWVKQEAAKLVGMLVSEFGGSTRSLEALPLSSSNGLKLTEEDLYDLTQRHLRLLREGVTEDLATQVARNLAFFSRCFAESKMIWRLTKRTHPQSRPH